jgi:hypothetical protein
MSEFEDDEKFATSFRHADGSVAHVFSSHHRKTVLRHFQWMQQYGIDGAFVQRFAVETFEPKKLNHCNTVLMHCREGANRFGRRYAVMYDLSGLRGRQMDRVIDDWKLLVDRMKIGHDEPDRAYLRVNGRPLVAVWGVGFNDGRRYSLADCEKFIRFLKDDPHTGWRTLNRDSLREPKLHEVIVQTDIVSPWTVGRYTSLDTVTRHAEHVWRADIEWCQQKGKEYLPVVFPGFVSTSKQKGRGRQ